MSATASHVLEININSLFAPCWLAHKHCLPGTERHHAYSGALLIPLGAQTPLRSTDKSMTISIGPIGSGS